AVMSGFYGAGILVSVLVGLFLKRFVFEGDAAPFLMELPSYRLPTPQNVLRQMWDKAKDFLKRAFTVIFLATLVVWLLQSFTFALSSAPDVAHSMLGGIAGSIAPLFAPAGFGTAEATMAVLTGIMAKESVVSTLAVLSGLDAQSAQMADHMRAIFPSTLSALSFLSFILLYTPCVAAIAAMRREMESTRWALCAVLAQTMLAWITAVILYQAGRLFGLA
ncbi:MAG: nucleoside recognition domain-containing protein, partial [Clostridia bacterium]